MMNISECCDAIVYPDTDICIECKEHCDVYCDEEELENKMDKLELYFGTIIFYIEKYGRVLVWALCLNIFYQIIRSV